MQLFLPQLSGFLISSLLRYSPNRSYAACGKPLNPFAMPELVPTTEWVMGQFLQNEALARGVAAEA